MSLNFDNVTISPNPVDCGGKYIISVSVWDDAFEFDEPSFCDVHQGFADEAQTIGGKFKACGRNLLSGTDAVYTRTKDDASAVGNSHYLVDSFDPNDLIGKTVTISFYVRSMGEYAPQDGANDQMKERFGGHGCVVWQDSTGTNPDKIGYPMTSLLHQRGIDGKRVSQTWTVTPPSGYDTIKPGSFRFIMQRYAKPAPGNDETWILSHPKLEIGSVATDWIPAQEDGQ